jgi:flagellar basal-body rod protein FlgB
MTIELNGPVTSLLVSALNASILRHEAIANNIANVNTPGYKAMQVSFEDQLSQIMNRKLLNDDDALRTALKNVEPVLYQTGRTTGMGELDMEMINLSKNTLHYHTLLKGMQGFGAITKMAIKEGKG